MIGWRLLNSNCYWRQGLCGELPSIPGLYAPHPVYVSGRHFLWSTCQLGTYVCRGFSLPWIVSLLSRGFIVSCSTTWSPGPYSGTGKEMECYNKFSYRILPHLGEGQAFPQSPPYSPPVGAIYTLPQWGVLSFTLMRTGPEGLWEPQLLWAA